MANCINSYVLTRPKSLTQLVEDYLDAFNIYINLPDDDPERDTHIRTMNLAASCIAERLAIVYISHRN